MQENQQRAQQMIAELQNENLMLKQSSEIKQREIELKHREIDAKEYEINADAVSEIDKLQKENGRRGFYR